MLISISPKAYDIPNILQSIYFVNDHMPHLKFEDRNSILTIFNQKNFNPYSTFFIFDTYLYFEEFRNNGFFTGHGYPYNLCLQYLNELPDYSLEFDNKTKFNCLMNKQRYQRIFASNWLANNFNTNKFIYSKPWESTAVTRKFISIKANLILEDIDLKYNWHNYLDSVPENYLRNTNHARLFKNGLYPSVFSESSISIVLEPISSEKGCLITEKYINAVYGGTIPLVDGFCIGNILSRIGFDTFTDLINYGYQFEVDPLRRVARMLNENIEFLRSSPDLIKNKEIQERLTNNFMLLRSPNRLLRNIIYNLNTVEVMDNFKKLTFGMGTNLISTVNEVLNGK